MLQGKQQALDILTRLAAQPAVAYWENGVAAVVQSVLGEAGLEAQVDQFGNILARVGGKNSNAPPLALVAHMDHPGFEAVEARGSDLVADVLGGVPAAALHAGVPVQVLLDDGRRMPAVTTGRWGGDDSQQVLIRLDEPAELKLPRPVVFDLVDFELDDDLIRMRAADDLAGCAAILAALGELATSPPPGDVYGVFTRAEEVGLVGARLLAESRNLPQDALIVSVESSRVLPGAEQGGGPVIRVGDAAMTFHADAEAALVRARESLRAGDSGVQVQRQLMSGGVCEASAFAHYGYRTTGIAFPLGNYHNAAPQGGVEAEYIDVNDFMGGIRLMTEAAYLVEERGDTAFSRRLREVQDAQRRRLANPNQARISRRPS